jgi:hypothetical protein
MAWPSGNHVTVAVFLVGFSSWSLSLKKSGKVCLLSLFLSLFLLLDVFSCSAYQIHACQSDIVTISISGILFLLKENPRPLMNLNGMCVKIL